MVAITTGGNAARNNSQYFEDSPMPTHTISRPM